MFHHLALFAMPVTGSLLYPTNLLHVKFHFLVHTLHKKQGIIIDMYVIFVFVLCERKFEALLEIVIFFVAFLHPIDLL